MCWITPTSGKQGEAQNGTLIRMETNRLKHKCLTWLQCINKVLFLSLWTVLNKGAGQICGGRFNISCVMCRSASDDQIKNINQTKVNISRTLYPVWVLNNTFCSIPQKSCMTNQVRITFIFRVHTTMMSTMMFT